MKIQGLGKFSLFFLAKWWFFDDFLMIFEGEKIKQNPRKSSKNHHFAWKNQENLPKTMKIQGFGKFSLFFLAKGWFFDDFLMIFEGEKIKQNPRKSSKNHHFARKNQENLPKTMKTQGFGRFSLFFSSKRMIFWWFPRVLLDFLSSKIIKKSSKKSSFC